MPGSISLLIDSPLRDLARSLRAVGPDVRKQINAATKAAANPIWFEEVRGGKAETKLTQLALVSTARTSVTSRNVTLKSGGATFKGGRSAENITRAAEFGGGAEKVISTRSRKGKAYKRRLGATFGPRYRKGRAVYPAASESIPRFASLWVQTARRTIHEALEAVSK